MAIPDVVSGGEDGVQREACSVPGVADELGESGVVHAVKEVGTIDVIVVVEMEIGFAEENVVVGVIGRGVMKSVILLQQARRGPGEWKARVPLTVVLLSVWSRKLVFHGWADVVICGGTLDGFPVYDCYPSARLVVAVGDLVSFGNWGVNVSPRIGAEAGLSEEEDIGCEGRDEVQSLSGVFA